MAASALMKADFPHINEVEPLSDSDQPLVDDLVEVLGRHGALGRFGIVLLHKHFEVEADEVLVEETNELTRVQIITPKKLADVENLPGIETSWSLETGRPMMRCICIKYGNDHQHQSRGLLRSAR